ncbi:MAG: alanyl-tRNA editing protein [Acidiferrobacterales bacterium]|nr:alanyl-tRNA editing protein [Acidiferrobacterales bacterium]
MTIELFREDGYLKTCPAKVIATTSNGFVVDQTVFYPMGGGQPGDQGVAKRADGLTINIIDCYVDRESGYHLHIVAEPDELPNIGDQVELEIDWDRRHRLMRIHSCLHMLCAAISDPVTGGSIGDGTGRLDFDMPIPPDKQAVEDTLNALIQKDAPMQLRWITEDEMDAQPDLVRTMSVQPPRGAGKVRLVDFNGVDLQPCGGTHVSRTGEIGPVRVVSIKKKGKMNRRITIAFAE